MNDLFSEILNSLLYSINLRMNEAQSLFNPRDDSLAEKVDAYYSVCWDYSRVQSSLKLTGQGKTLIT